MFNEKLDHEYPYLYIGGNITQVGTLRADFDYEGNYTLNINGISGNSLSINLFGSWQGIQKAVIRESSEAGYNTKEVSFPCTDKSTNPPNIHLECRLPIEEDWDRITVFLDGGDMTPNGRIYLTSFFPIESWWVNLYLGDRYECYTSNCISIIEDENISWGYRHSEKRIYLGANNGESSRIRLLFSLDLYDKRMKQIRDVLSAMAIALFFFFLTNLREYFRYRALCSQDIHNPKQENNLRDIPNISPEDPVTKMTNIKENHRLSVLFTLLATFLGILFGMLEGLSNVSTKTILYRSVGSSFALLFLLVITFFIFRYVLTILKAIYYETTLFGKSNISESKLKEKQLAVYTDTLNRLPYALFASLPFVGWALLYPIIGFLSIPYAILIFVGEFSIYITLNKGIYRKKVELSHEFKEFFIVFFFDFKAKESLLFLLYLLSVGILFSGVNIELEESGYCLDEDIYVQVTPYGVFKPRIEAIYYANELIYNGTGKEFPASPRYLVIDSAKASPEGYNSHIGISFRYFDKAGLNLLKGNNLKFVPVYPTPCSDNSNK